MCGAAGAGRSTAARSGGAGRSVTAADGGRSGAWRGACGTGGWSACVSRPVKRGATPPAAAAGMASVSRGAMSGALDAEVGVGLPPGAAGAAAFGSCGACGRGVCCAGGATRAAAGGGAGPVALAGLVVGGASQMISSDKPTNPTATAPTPYTISVLTVGRPPRRRRG